MAFARLGDDMKKSTKSGRRAFGAAGITIATIGTIILLYFADFVSIYLRIVFALALLVTSGVAIQKTLGLIGSYGLYMMGSRKGLKAIDHISKRHMRFWDAMAMWGLTMGFGLFTYLLVKGKIDKRVFAFGMISIVFVVIFVQPYFAAAFQFIEMPALQSATSGQASALQQNVGWLSYALVIISAVFGFSGYIFVSVFSNTVSILIGMAQFLFSYMSGVTNTSTLSNQIPGIAPVIPGVNIPLMAGMAALVILLVIHEASHGVLARIAGVKLKSVGLLLFGIIPIGAFVEPDEKRIKLLGRSKQTRIFSAGIAANLIATVVFFVLMLFFLTYVIPNTYNYGIVVKDTIQSYPADGILKTGMQILQWNGKDVVNMSTLAVAAAPDKPNTIVSVVTDNGTFAFRAVAEPDNYARGIIGVSISYQPIVKTPYERFVYFLYTLVALSMLLNFFVAVVNLLPIPGFDGWRIYKTNIKNNKFTGFLAALVVVGLAINALPWLF
jgi:Zn-dependent protease